MKLYCALCGRSMRQAAVFIGEQAVGPKCSRRSGLLPHVPVKSEAVRVDERQIDMFDPIEKDDWTA